MDISVLDYGIGNLHSLVKALERGGRSVRVDARASDAARADVVVLPGVGNFGMAAIRLEAERDALREAILAGKPCLGICLGMQLLFAGSEEAAGHGLGILGGRVVRMSGPRLPHIGWNDVESAGDPLFDGLVPFTAYFANGYVCAPDQPGTVIAWTQYGADRWPSAVRSGQVVGVQFHPEKSGVSGLRLLDNFLRAAGA